MSEYPGKLDLKAYRLGGVTVRIESILAGVPEPISPGGVVAKVYRYANPPTELLTFSVAAVDADTVNISLSGAQIATLPTRAKLTWDLFVGGVPWLRGDFEYCSPMESP